MPQYNPEPFPSCCNGRIDWPWNKESERLPNVMPDGSPWPRVSIVTPSYNQAQYLEETIRSVLLQGYPNIEYIIIDGGSTDGSVEIIKRYEPWLTYWISEKDQGQSHAIQKGFEHASGEIFAWLNSDDTFAHDTIYQAALALQDNPETILVYGDCNLIDHAGQAISVWHTRPCSWIDLVLESNLIPQQTAFFHAKSYRSVNGVNLSLNYIMDYELWLRLSHLGTFLYSPKLIANFRCYPESKSLSNSVLFWEEHLRILEQLNETEAQLNNDVLKEARRRFQIKAALECLINNKIDQALFFIEKALESGWPYGNPSALARQMLDHYGLGGKRLIDQPGLLQKSLEIIHQISDGRKAHRLSRAILSYDAMRHVFIGYSQGNTTQIRSNLWSGLFNDPGWFRNRGVWKIIFYAYVPHVARIDK
jgi:glycosyltransferase involved in cell wall biosynthesis